MVIRRFVSTAALAAAAALVVPVSANAAVSNVIPPGTLDFSLIRGVFENGSTSGNVTAFPSMTGNDFSAVYCFDVGALFDITGNFVLQQVSGFRVLLDGVDLVDSSASIPGFQFGVSNLAPGAGSADHSLTFLGTVTDPNVSFNYAGIVNISSAIPEPAALLMMLAGVGLLTGVARRRNSV